MDLLTTRHDQKIVDRRRGGKKRKRIISAPASSSSSSVTKGEEEDDDKSKSSRNGNGNGNDNDKNNDGKQQLQKILSRHHFATVALDHCETPAVAYQHLHRFLEEIAKARNTTTNSNINSLRIWDPFYCDGSTKRILMEQLGFLEENVLHENVDFYQLIRERSTIPQYNVLVTNPPYSGDHIDRLLAFVVASQQEQQQQPKNDDENNNNNCCCCCLLLPNWVSRKQDYKDRFVDPLEKAGCEIFYLSPLEAYTYTMPSWVANEERPEHVDGTGQTTPYLSSWYIVVPSSLLQRKTSPKKNAAKHHDATACSGSSSFLDVMDGVARKQRPPVWVVAKTIRGLKWKIQKAQKINKKSETKQKTMKSTTNDKVRHGKNIRASYC